MVELEQVKLLQTWVVFGGLFIGLVFGMVSQASRYCSIGAISDLQLMGNGQRMRLWLLSVLVAVVLVQLFIQLNLLNDEDSFYTSPRLLWLSNVFGGLLFGVGMALASGCGSRNLVRIGEGSLKALVVFLVMGISAFATLRGLTAVWRSQTVDQIYIDLPSRQDLPSLLESFSGLSSETGRILVLLAVLLLVFWALLKGLPGRRLTASQWLAGSVVGLCVAAGWLLTGWLGFVAEHPETLEKAYLATNTRGPESLTFVAPLSYSLELFLYYSDSSQFLSFAVATVIGTVAGAAAAALRSGSFRWQGFASTQDLALHLLGATLMGVGGVVAMGCTIGHGLSGLSMLALSSVIAIGSIGVGGLLGLLLLQKLSLS
ncbi:MAG: YeeE/YedE family protein [Burkholderiaceae bacterium]